MAEKQSTSARPTFQPTDQHNDFNTALLLWHIAGKVVVASSGCWEWPHVLKSRGGYGCIGKGRTSVRAHRLIYELCVGPIPEGVNVLHRCDNPPCCRPDHLFLGTQQDNVDDCRQKGRFVINRALGERNAKSKLTAEQVLAIRRAAKSEGLHAGLCQRLGLQYGVHRRTIRGIITGEHWKHVRE